MNLKLSKFLFYNLIYSLELVKLKIIKTYIETKLTNDFIPLSKFSAKISIFFVMKLDRSFSLCINYGRQNNPTIKNIYLLL